MVSRSPPPFARMSAITCWAPANGRGGGAVAGGLQLAAKTVGEASFQGRRVPFSWDPLDLAGGEGGTHIQKPPARPIDQRNIVARACREWVRMWKSLSKDPVQSQRGQ